MYTESTIGHRVGSLHFGNELHHVVGVVLVVDVGSFHASCAHRFEFLTHIGGEGLCSQGKIDETRLALRSIDHCSRILAGRELLVDALHLLLHSLAISGAGADHIVDEFQIAHFIVETEEFLETIVDRLQVAILDLHFLIGDVAVGESGHEGIGRLRARVKLRLGADGVGRHRSHEQRLVFGHEQFATKLLVGVSPELLDRVDLLGSFRRQVLPLHALDLLEESLQCRVIEASGLAHEHRQVLEGLRTTLSERFLHIFFRNLDAELVTLVLHEFVLHIVVPDLVAHHVCLFVSERTAVAKLHHLRSFVHHV